MDLKEGLPKKLLMGAIGLFILWLVMHYWDRAVGLLGLAMKALMPLLIGFAIAYALNILMVPIERRLTKIFKDEDTKKVSRPLSLICAFLILIGVAAAIVALVVPKLWMCFEVLARQISEASVYVIPYLSNWISPEFLAELNMQNIIGKFGEWLVSMMGGTLTGIATSVGSFFSSIVTVFIAVVLSVYLLLGKERLLENISILMEAYLPKRVVDPINRVTHVANGCFRRYIVGQCIEAVILGTLCGIGMAIFQFPYAAMIGCVVGATALVPFVGAYIGGAVGAILILTVSPMQAVGFVIFLVILQQIEGNVIYPRVVGSSINLPGMWVLIAIAIGGGFGGIVGIFLSVPIMATVYQLLKDGTAERRAKIAAKRAARRAAAAAAAAGGAGDVAIQAAGASDGSGDVAVQAVATNDPVAESSADVPDDAPNEASACEAPAESSPEESESSAD